MKQLALIFTILCVGCGGTEAPVELASQGYSHKLLREAIETAKSRLDDFIATLESENGSEFAIKEVITNDGVREFIWLTDVKFADDKFEGKVAHTPNLVVDIKLGDIRTVPKSNVVDWKYEDDGKTFGNFTLRVLIDSVPENDRADYEVGAGD